VINIESSVTDLRPMQDAVDASYASGAGGRKANLRNVRQQVST
jgi:hypothetical protein